MKKEYLLGGAAIAVVAAVTGTWVIMGENGSSEENVEATAAVQAGAQSAAASLASSTASTQSAGQPFAQSPNAPYAHEIYPTPAADAAAALGAFSYHVTDLGGGKHTITISNNAEGYTPQSVTVTDGQSVYFIERSPRDDTDQEDANTRDDYLLVVNADGSLAQ